jgi:superfamily I DNA/RNA helicase
MPRKKKVEEVKNIEYPWSKYQQDIFDFVAHKQGNAIINAAAGAAKTTTAIKCLDFIPTDSKVLFVAFNKDIVLELQKKIGNRENVEVKTLHSLGLSILKRNIGNVHKLVPDEFKYKSYVYQNISSLSELYDTLSFNLKKDYTSSLFKLLDFGRFNLCQTENDLLKLSEKYHIDLFDDILSTVVKIMEWGENNLDTVDFTDMIWLPNRLNLQTWGSQYDFIIVDESQDLNGAQLAIVLKCRKINTRLLFYGDKNQAIYAFSGADHYSIDKLKQIPNTIELPLSISYRVPKEIVQFAQRLVPSIEWNDDGRVGKILYNVSLNDVKEGDVILCRNNAPLIQTYIYYLNKGVKCTFLGKDIGKNIITRAKNTGKTNFGKGLYEDGIMVRLYDSLFRIRDYIMESKGVNEEMAIESEEFQNRYDVIKSIEVLSKDLPDDKTSLDMLTDKVSKIFKEEGKESIFLSSIHKFKGKENLRVFICMPSLMPSKSAKTKEELEEEKHIAYVAYTRAKDTLCFLNETEYSEIKNDSHTISSLKVIEDKVNKVLGKGKKTPLTREEFVKTYLYNPTVIEKKEVKHVNLGEVNSRQEVAFEKSENPFIKFKKKKINRR